MSKLLSAFATIIKLVFAVGVLTLLGLAGWVGYEYYGKHQLNERRLAERERELEAAQQEVATLTTTVAEQGQEIQRLDMAVHLLKVDRRLAQMIVLEQGTPPGAERLQTTFRLVETNEEGLPIGEPQIFTINGDVVYIDTWVAKFADEHVEQGDPLRGASIVLFRRLFGEYQEPQNGFAIDTIGTRPTAYSRGSEMSDFERDIWTNFWDYANDPQRASEAGLRALHGEAPSIQLRKGKLYRLNLRASDGLTITAEDLPAALLDAGM